MKKQLISSITLLLVFCASPAFAQNKPELPLKTWGIKTDFLAGILAPPAIFGNTTRPLLIPNKIVLQIPSWAEVYDGTGLRLPSWAESQKKKTKSIKKTAVKKKPAVSGFWSYFRSYELIFNKIQLEIGFNYYYFNRFTKLKAGDEYWALNRFEPFIKLQWSVLDGYLLPYIIFAMEKTTLNYKLTGLYAFGMKVDLGLDLASSGTPFLGAGAEFFVLGWKGLKIGGYGQMQIASLNEAKVRSAHLYTNGKSADISALVTSDLDVLYNVQRYDCGAIVSYQVTSWFMPWITVGYIWMNASLKLTVSDALSAQLERQKITDPYAVIPRNYGFDNSNFLGLLGMKFKIYKALHVAMQGAVVPAKQTVFLGQFTLLFEGSNNK